MSQFNSHGIRYDPVNWIPPITDICITIFLQTSAITALQLASTRTPLSPLAVTDLSLDVNISVIAYLRFGDVPRRADREFECLRGDDVITIGLIIFLNIKFKKDIH